jgi:hypothetical protein
MLKIRVFVRTLLIVQLFVVAALHLRSQGIFATLTGVVTDPSGANVSGAKVTLTDAQSGSARDTTTDGQGYYTFASVPVGTYNLNIEAAGFQAYKISGISLGGGERRNVNAGLKVGNSSETLEVTSGQDVLAPVDSGEKSPSHTNK